MICVGGEHSLAVSGVLQLVRQSRHLQPHLQGFPRRLPRHLLVPSSSRHHGLRCTRRRRHWNQHPRRRAAAAVREDRNSGRPPPRHHPGQPGAAAAAAELRRRNRQSVSLFQQSPPGRLTHSCVHPWVRLGRVGSENCIYVGWV